MGISYLSFCIGLMVLTGVICFGRKRPIWWVAVVGVLPITFPVFIFKTRTIPVKFYLICFLTGVLAVGAIEYYLYTDHREKNKYAHLPPIVREMIRFNEQIKKSTIEIYYATGKLESVSLSQSRVSDMETAINLIRDLRQKAADNQAAIDSLIQYIRDHETFIQRQNLDWAFWIGQFYTHRHVIQHQDSRRAYYRAFEDVLQYAYKHFDHIMELQSSAHMANYDAYYMRYRAAAETHNRFTRKRIDFSRKFVQEHPEIKPFLPGAHHLEPFRFWDKMNF